MKKWIFSLVLITMIASIYNFTQKADAYGLNYVIQEDKIYLSWEKVQNQSVYLLKILEDGVEVSTQWIEGTKATIVDDFEGEIIEFLVAASGKDYSDPVKYNKFVPKIYNPYGTVEQGKISFSWSSYDNVEYYHVQIESLDGNYKENFRTKKDNLTVSDLIPREYKWRVITEDNSNLGVQGEKEQWVYFKVSSKTLDAVNVFGIEKDSPIPVQSIMLSYPESALMTKEGVIYIADSHSNVIRKCENGISEVVVGTLVAGKNNTTNPKEFMLDMPGGMVFDQEENIVFTDLGNKRICKYNIEKNVMEVLWNHGKWAKNVYLNQDDSLTLMEDTGKIINNKHGILLEGYPFYYPAAMVSEGSKVVVLDANKYELILFDEGEFQKKIPLVRYSSALFYDGSNIYLGEHTAIYKLGWDLSKELISDGYANVSNISIGNMNELLITDSDSGSIYTLNLSTLKKRMVVGARNLSGAIVKIEKQGEFLYFLDNQAATVWRYTPETGLTERFIGNGKNELATIGANRLETGMFYPSGFTSDSKGNFYISEQHHIIKINNNGVVELFAGRPGRVEYGYRDGDAREALFMSIRGIFYDEVTESLYIADTYNNMIRKVKDGIVSTVAGNGLPGGSIFGENAISTRLNHPHDVIIANGELIIADSWNNVVSKVDKKGTIYSVAGNQKEKTYQGGGSYFGDGIKAREALFDTPTSLFYEENVLYIVDSFNNRIRVVENEEIRTILGNNQKGYDPNNPSTLNMPTSVYADEKYIYIADGGNYLVRRYLKERYMR